VATKERKFTLKDYEQLVQDVIRPYFQNENVTHDIEDLMEAQTVTPPVSLKRNGERELKGGI